MEVLSNGSEHKLKKIEISWLEGKFCDFTIRSRDREFKTHKLILNCCSQYFECLFSSNFKEAKENEVLLNDIEPEIIELCLQYCYTSSVKICSHEIAIDLYKAANRLIINDLVTLCSDYLTRNINSSTCIALWLVSDELNQVNSTMIARRFSEDTFESLVKENDFLLLNVEKFEELISSNYLPVEDEMIVLDSLVKWTLAKPEERLPDCFERLIEYIKFPKLDLNRSIRYFLNDQYKTIANIEKFKSLLRSVDAYQYLKLPERILLKEKEPWKFINRNLSKNCLIICTKNLIYKFDPVTDNWIQLYIKSDIGMFTGCSMVRDHMLYCFKDTTLIGTYDLRGGVWSNISHQFSGEPQCSIQNVSYNNSVFFFNISEIDAKNIFIFNSKPNYYEDPNKFSAMSCSRFGCSASLYNDKIYVTGGYDSETKSYLATIECYDINNDEWSFFHVDLKSPRFQHSSVITNGKLYVAGGKSSGDSTATSSFECYDFKTKSWEILPNMLEARNNFKLVVLNGLIYAIGGSSQKTNTSIESYDMFFRRWTKRRALPITTSTLGACSYCPTQEYIKLENV